MLINKIVEFKKMIGFSLKKGEYGKDAAVCALINENQEVLLIKRIEREEDPWSGQISFPGGHFEIDDKYLHITALRELKEETGIENVKIIGELEVQHPRNLPELNVYPFLCFKENFNDLRAQKDEVKYFLTPKIFELKKSKKIFQINDKNFLEDCFEFNGEIIWGLTYRILLEIMNLFKNH